MFRYNVLKTPAVNLSQGSRFEVSLPQDEPLKPLFAAETGSSFSSNDRKRQPKKETVDVFHGAISLQGLPLAVILEGSDPETTNEDVQKAGAILMGFLENLAQSLHESPLDDIKIKDLLRQEYLKLDQSYHGQVAAVAFSAVVTFKNPQGLLKALSFGMGNTLLALDNEEEVETVIAAQAILHQSFLLPLTFPYARTEPARQEPLLRHLEIDIRALKPNDRLLFLTDGAYEHLNLEEQEKEEKEALSEAEQTVLVRRSLKKQLILTQTNFHVLAQQANQQVLADFQSQATRKTISLGDDLTVAELIIPSDDIQQDLQAFFYEKAKVQLEETLADANLPETIRQRFTPVKEKIAHLRSLRAPDLPALTKALIKTTEVIQKRENESVVKDYLKYAREEVSGKTSFLWKALGRTMQAAGAMLALLGGLTIVGSLGLCTELGAGFLASGLGLAGLGTVFYGKGEKRNLQGEMVKTGEACLDHMKGVRQR